MIDGVGRAITGPSQLSIADSGAIAYLPGPVGVADAQQLVAIADRAGVITKLAIRADSYRQVRVSPDGKQLALAVDDGKDAGIYVVPLDGTTTPRRLALAGRNSSPVWSSDGRWLAFQSVRDNERGIYRQRADGSGITERLTTAAAGENHTPTSWSPDGRLLAYDVRPSPSPSRGPSSSTIWLLTIATGKSEPFGGVTSVDHTAATFSPDGKWIAYSRSSSVDPQAVDRGVFVQPVPANGTILQAPRQVVDYHPVWSRGGKELVFIASTVSRQMAAMSITINGTALTFGQPQRFPATVTGDLLANAPRSFDVLPDGRLIGLVSENETGPASAPTEFHVVLNWLSEVRQRVR